MYIYMVINIAYFMAIQSTVHMSMDSFEWDED